MKHFVFCLFGLLTITWLTNGAELLRPNILYIVVDDLGSYGGKQIPTPHLDHLAAEVVQFTQGYVTASLCAPLRATLLTRPYQTRFGYPRAGMFSFVRMWVETSAGSK